MDLTKYQPPHIQVQSCNIQQTNIRFFGNSGLRDLLFFLCLQNLSYHITSPCMPQEVDIMMIQAQFLSNQMVHSFHLIALNKNHAEVFLPINYFFIPTNSIDSIFYVYHPQLTEMSRKGACRCDYSQEGKKLWSTSNQFVRHTQARPSLYLRLLDLLEELEN